MSLDVLTGVSHSLAPLTKFYSTWLWKQTVVSSNEPELCRYYLHFLNLLRILNTIFLSGRENNYIQVKIKSKQNSQKVQKCLSENMSWILLRIFECRLASKKIFQQKYEKSIYKAVKISNTKVLQWELLSTLQNLQGCTSWEENGPEGMLLLLLLLLLLLMLFSHEQLFATLWTATCQASLSFTISKKLLKLISIELSMPSNHLNLWRPLLLLPSIFPSIRIFSNELALHIRWPTFWSFSFSISPFNEYSGLISFRIDWFDLLAVQRTFKSSATPQFENIKFLALSLLYGPTLISIHEYWKIHSFD